MSDPVRETARGSFLKRSRLRMLWFLFAGVFGCLVLMGFSVKTGAADLPWERMVESIFATSGDDLLERDRAIVWELRLPRTLLAFLVGGALGIAGAGLQGLFRNPLADPGLIGVASGGALGAVMAIVLGIPSFLSAFSWINLYTLPIAAFVGSLLSTAAIYRIAATGGRVRVGSLLLAGIAVNAIAGASLGWLAFRASDVQLRELTFWTMGSLGGARWDTVGACFPFALLVVALMPRYARGLNALALGESDAMHLGIAVEPLKRSTVVLSALAVGAAVSVAGTIGFVGLVAPHIVRMAAGPDHRVVIPGSFLVGAALLLASDIVARVAVAPAELPVGIVVATVGAPFFLYLLLREKGRASF